MNLIKLSFTLNEKGDIWHVNALLAEISQDSLRATVAGFCLSIIRYRDTATYLHSHNVLAIARKLLDELRICGHDREVIEIGCLLHDFGKIIVSGSLLRKNSMFNDDEYDKIKSHTVIGFNIMKLWGSYIPDEALEIILSHHEKNGGTGYPYKKDNLPFHVEVCAIADIAAAMQEHRHHRAGHSLECSIRELKKYKWRPEITLIIDTKPEIFELQEDSRYVASTGGKISLEDR